MGPMEARVRVFRTRHDRRPGAALGAALGALLLILAALPLRADESGLLWNRSGLPATFPLQVRSDPGLHWRVTLIDSGSGAPALAAHFRGGRFFRVLVPPGTYTLVFEAGPDWRGAGFGAGGPTRSFAYGRQLVFGVRGLSRKVGHIVDIRAAGQQAQAPVPRRLAICQRQRLRPPEEISQWRRPADPLDLHRFRWRRDVIERYC